MDVQAMLPIWSVFVLGSMVATVMHINAADPMLFMGNWGDTDNPLPWKKLIGSGLLGVMIGIFIAYVFFEPTTSKTAGALALVLIPQIHNGQLKRTIASKKLFGSED